MINEYKMDIEIPLYPVWHLPKFEEEEMFMFRRIRVAEHFLLNQYSLSCYPCYIEILTNYTIADFYRRYGE